MKLKTTTVSGDPEYLRVRADLPIQLQKAVPRGSANRPGREDPARAKGGSFRGRMRAAADPGYPATLARVCAKDTGYRVRVDGRVKCTTMEIHAPHHPTLTFKEALVHLCIVTTGILIALSLEGTLEWWHHRQLVRETRQRLQSEIRGNQNSIQTVLKSLGPAKTRFIHAIEVVSDLSAPGKLEEGASIFSPGRLTLTPLLHARDCLR